MNVIRRNIPNSLTCLNLLCGVLAIISGVHAGSPVAGGLTGTQLAWIFIAGAAVADFCDGFAARLLGAYSSLGKELDSLCDNVSFGVAPAVSLYFALRGISPSSAVAWAALIIPICGALRLAKFNIDESQTTHFRGLPIPANAIFWIGYMALMQQSELLATPGIFLPVVIIESWLMVSPLNMFSLKMKNIGWKEHWKQWLLIIAAIVFICSMGVSGLMWLILFYVCLSLIPERGE